MTAIALTKAEVQMALVHDHVSGLHADRDATLCPVCERRSTVLSEVWCSRCDKPSVKEVEVTDGARTYRAAYCSTHLWAVTAPAMAR